MVVDPLLMENSLDKVLIRDYVVEGSIGVLEKEKINKQPIVFNINVYVERINQVPEDIKEVLDYRLIINIIDKLVYRSHYELQEQLAEKLAQEILKLALVKVVCIRVEKPQAFSLAKSVGVEILRRKQ